MSSKTYVILTFASLLAALLLLILEVLLPAPVLRLPDQLLMLAATLLALYYLYYHGSLRYNKRRGFLFACFSGMIIGLLFKIQHWEGAGMLLLTTSTATGIVYALFFLGKPKKKRSDFLKLLYVLSAVAGVTFRMNHWPYADYFSYASVLLLWMTFIDVVQEQWGGDQKGTKTEQPSFFPDGKDT